VPLPELPGLRPLTARSVVLSTLLGAHPPRLPARSLVRAGELFEIAEGTVRVALSRMVAAGDLRHVDGDYELSDRLVRRQARQDQSRSPAVRPWSGDWEIAVVTADRRPRADRAVFRQTMAGLRLAEAREGTWLRPANLDRPVELSCLVLIGRPTTDPTALAATLWDLPAWADGARRLHAALDRADGLAAGFMVSAAVLRHLVADPLLPETLLPPDWPGPELRARYEQFDRTFQAMLRERLDVSRQAV
jgi:phenylacetic acid degradation operon negative regulatory protein